MARFRLPSEEKPWLKWHVEGAQEKATEPFENITLYRFIARKLREQGDTFPAFQYFGARIRRSEVLAQTDRWARMFRGMGVSEDDRVIVFIPFTPEAVYIIFALNKIGAWPVMLNLGSGSEALSKGCSGAEYAVVSDAVESHISHVLRGNPAFRHVVVLSMASGMPRALRRLYTLKKMFSRSRMMREARNYITSEEALRRWDSFDGEVEAPCEIDRPAIVTSTSGTSKAGYSKQIPNSNGAVVSMIKQMCLTTLPSRFKAGDRCYTGLPPFISTSMLALLLFPLYYNMTCFIDPRMDAGVFTKNLLKCRPQLCLITGRCWVYFFTRIERMIKKGRTPDLSFLRIPIMGGDGIVVKDLRWMNSLLRQCGSKYGICSGYGMSEMFSLLSVDPRDGFVSDGDARPVISVGVPIPGSDVAIMDADGHELGYGQRGEICARGMTLMKGYYNDKEQTEKAIRGGWYHSGDLGCMDEDGHIFVFGRMSSCYIDEHGCRHQPFDLENRIARDDDVHYCLVNNMARDGEKPRLAMHLVLVHGSRDRDAIIRRIDREAKEFLGDGQSVEGYRIHRHIFKMNKVLKLDRRYYKNQLSGYIRPEDGRMVKVSFI